MKESRIIGVGQQSSESDGRIFRVPTALVGGLLGVASVVFLRQSFVVDDERILALHAYVFSEVKWFAFHIVLAVWSILLLIGKVERRRRMVFHLFDGLVLIFVGWSLISLLWAPDLRAATLSLLYGGTGALTYLLARVTAQAAAFDVLHVAALTGLAVSIAMSAVPDRGIENGFGNENFTAEYVTAATVLAGCFWMRGASVIRWTTRFFVVLSLLFLFFVAAANLQFLGLLSVLFVALYLSSSRKATRVSLVSVVLVAVTTAILVLFLAPDLVEGFGRNIRDRMQIWANTVLLIAEAPVLGHGLGSYYYEYGAFIDRYLEVFSFLGAPAFDNFARQTDSAENEFLQVMTELGIVGLIILGSAVVLIWRQATRFSGAATIRNLVLPLVAVLAMSLVSFPIENPATLVLASSVMGVFASLSVPAPEGNPEQEVGNQPVSRVLAGFVLIAAAVTLPGSFREIPAAMLFAHAEALDRSGQVAASAEKVLEATEITQRSPRLRLRAYTQSMIAGPSFWNRLAEPLDLDVLYARATTAAPSNPVLLDLRLKQLLSSSGRTIVRSEVEALLRALRRNSGQTNANAFILEAAFAVQLGDAARARAALDRAKELVKLPPTPNDETNLRNIRALEAVVGR